MAHRKREYEASGHSVTIQQVNEGGGISAWIDGNAAHMADAFDKLADAAPLTIANKVENLLDGGETWKAFETALGWMVDNDLYFCKKCNSFYPSENVVRTHFAGHKCGECARSDNTCPETPDGEHDMECLNPHQKHNARVATKYKCTECGYQRQTTPTG